MIPYDSEKLSLSISFSDWLACVWLLAMVCFFAFVLHLFRRRILLFVQELYPRYLILMRRAVLVRSIADVKGFGVCLHKPGSFTERWYDVRCPALIGQIRLMQARRFALFSGAHKPFFFPSYENSATNALPSPSLTNAGPDKKETK